MSTKTPPLVTTIAIVYWLRLAFMVIAIALLMYGANKVRGESGLSDFAIGYVSGAFGENLSQYNYFMAGQMSLSFMVVTVLAGFTLLALRYRSTLWVRTSLAAEFVGLLLFGGLWWIPAIVLIATFSRSFREYASVQVLTKNDFFPS